MSKNIRKTIPDDMDSIPNSTEVGNDNNVADFPSVEETKESEKTKSKRGKQVRVSGSNKPYSEQRAKINKIFSLFLLCVGGLLFISMLSHLFYWWKDYDTLSVMTFADVFSADYKVHNIGGRLGGFLSHFFINLGFGISSILIPVCLVLFGLHLLGYKKIKFCSLYFKFIFILLWLSLFLGSIGILRTSYFYILSGNVGMQTSLYLESLMGKVGLFLLLFFTLICFLVFVYNLNFAFFSKFFKFEETSKEQVKAEDTELKKDKIVVSSSEELDVSDTISTLFTIRDLEDTQEEHIIGNGSAQNIMNTKEPEFEETRICASIKKTTESIAQEEKEIEFSIVDTTLITEKEAVKIEKPTHYGVDTPYDPRLELPDYKFPPMDLLVDFGDQANENRVMQEELNENKNRIIETLRNYYIEISQIKATIGPTVTLYEIIPAAGVRISKIKNLEDDIALSLSALGIRIIAPIPGKGTIGIEVPNIKKQIVSMRDMFKSDKFTSGVFDLPIALGKTISNEPYVTDLAKMPHLLVAGATGQGKSVGLNAIIASLLFQKHPAELKFVMVDPKKVELSLFNHIERHYLAKLPDSEEAVITDTKKVVKTLNSLCIEMDNRYDLLKDAGVKNLKEYNAKFISRRLNPNDGHRYMPYIVLVIDEFADLIMVAGKEVELPIARLAQLARAIGIHLIIATQRPSVNVITGTIKANFPARLAFKVSSKIDSRTILDSPGADQLIGKGDMLLSTGADLIRIQCAFIDTPEIDRITEYISGQRAYPDAYELPDCPEEGQATLNKDFADDEMDSLFEDAAHLVVSSQQGSASNLQRKFKIGYNRAGRIIDQMESVGIIGPFDGKKIREVKIKDVLVLEELLKNM